MNLVYFARHDIQIAWEVPETRHKEGFILYLVIMITRNFFFNFMTANRDRCQISKGILVSIITKCLCTLWWEKCREVSIVIIAAMFDQNVRNQGILEMFLVNKTLGAQLCRLFCYILIVSFCLLQVLAFL